MHALLPLILTACIGGSDPAPVADPQPEPIQIRKKTVLSDPYHVDAKYRSMRGPWSQQHVYLWESPKVELLWITGYETTVVNVDSDEEVSQEFMCHANLDFDVEQYFDDFDLTHGLSGRVFTLSQGQQHIQFPEGFGVPILSSMPLKLTTQVLNLNVDDPNMNIRHQVTVEYVRDEDLNGREMVPMFQAAVQGFKSLEGEGLVYGVESPDIEEHGGGCAIGMSAIQDDIDYDRLGRKFTAHWVVEPGYEEMTTNATQFLGLDFDTKAHYIAVHLHPFAQSLELVDRTTGESVFKAEPTNRLDRIGLSEVPFLVSTEGIPLYKDHQYDLVSVYNNTSGVEQDSMAVMYIYMNDTSWKKPNLEGLTLAPIETPDDIGPSTAPAPGMGSEPPSM